MVQTFVINIDNHQYSDITLSQEPCNIKEIHAFVAIFPTKRRFLEKNSFSLKKASDYAKIFYFLLRGMILIGVPSKVNALRIWFSKKRA